MDYISKYLNKHLVPEQFISPWHKHVSISIVIPCFNEPELENTLQSILACDPIDSNVEVLILINSGEETAEQIINKNRKAYNKILSDYPFDPKTKVNFKPILIEGIRKKHQGAGYGRKLGMDLAVSMFYGIQRPNGLIVSLDADTLVKSNYLHELYKVYLNRDIEGGVINFEHPVDASENIENCAILLYELHLRYYHHALKYIGFPYAFYTLGSAFFIRVEHYVKQGGMNRRQGGEDFYFLHKVLPNIRYKILNETMVMPSARLSDRVPFGTGPRLREYIRTKEMKTYRLAAFKNLKSFYENIDAYYSHSQKECRSILDRLDVDMKSLLTTINFECKVLEIKQNTGSTDSFRKRFYQTFNGFFIVKYLNYVHQLTMPMIDVTVEAEHLISTVYHKNITGALEQLNFFRDLDRYE